MEVRGNNFFVGQILKRLKIDCNKKPSPNPMLNVNIFFDKLFIKKTVLITIYLFLAFVRFFCNSDTAYDLFIVFDCRSPVKFSY